MKNIPLPERLAIIVIIIMLLASPLTGQYLIQAILSLSDWVFRNGAYIQLVGLLYLLGWLTSRYIKSERLKLPTGQTTGQHYIETGTGL